MNIPNNGELRQITSNHSSDINSKDLMNIYQERTAKPNSSLVIGAALASDNPLHFRLNL